MNVIGILYTGDLGSEVARLLTEAGHSVITTVQGRSEQTKLLAEKAGISTDYSLEGIAQAADIVISLVPPTITTVPTSYSLSASYLSAKSA